MKKGDTVRLTATFECPGQPRVKQGTEARICSVNAYDKIATIDVGEGLPVVPMTLLEVIKEASEPKFEGTTDAWYQKAAEEEISDCTAGNPVLFEVPVEEAHESPTGSLRYNKNKLPMHLVPPSAVEAIAKVLEKGMVKYGDRNWEKGAQYSVPYASLMRHLMAWWGGETYDLETGLPHSHHILMNAAMIVEYEKMYEHDFDDRPKRR